MIVWLIAAAAFFLWLPVIIFRIGLPRLHALFPVLLLVTASLVVVLGSGGIAAGLIYCMYCIGLYGLSAALVAAARPARKFMLPEVLTAACALGLFGGHLLSVGSRGWALSLIVKTNVPLNMGNIFGINVLHGLFYNQTPLSGYLLRFAPWWQIVLIPIAAALLLGGPAFFLRTGSGVSYDH